MRNLMLAGAIGAALWMPLSGRSAGDTPLEAAAFAWDRGDYVSALTTYLELLAGNPTPETIETIALQTGELFHTLELTTDGDAPKFSPDGRHITFETGTLPERVIRISLAEAPTQAIATLPGHRAVFSPDGSRLAYLKVAASAALTEAAAALDVGPANQRNQRVAALNALVARESRIVIRDLASGRETEIPAGDLEKQALAFTSKGLVVAAAPVGATDGQLYAVAEGSSPAALTTGEGDKIIGEVSRGGAALTYTVRRGGAGRGGRGGGQAGGQTFFLLTVVDGRSTPIAGTAPTFSADGSSLAWVARSGPAYQLMVAPVADPGAAAMLRGGPERIDAPALSPGGQRVAYQVMAKEDWEIHVVGRDGAGDERVTREIQHDLLPRFLDDHRLLGMIGEARHRRSHVYDLAAKSRTRVFHNNTVRTIAPEYQWVPSPDGQKILIVAERDGDTVSVERGVYLVDLSRRVTADALRARVKANLAAEQALRAKTLRIFAPIADEVRTVVGQASVARVFDYEKALFDFDSKHITKPGNKLASEYLLNKYKSFGYAAEYQWFAGRGALGGQTANVLATLKGTVNPELVYVVSSHYDSVAVGPGADDDTSGTAALLEAARIMAKHPQPATIIFASFTGEEAGLLGSREFVRQAVASKMRLVGALNNDMIGWANDHRLDNTIRYSNAGIRDIQHGAAIHFTDLITYDALYYKSTDAAAYYEAYGDIVGGIGSYPVLGNPHYHQSHDLLDTINHQLVTEVAKTTAATLMLLASSPSRLVDLKVDSFQDGTARLSWTPSPEAGVTGYIVAYGPASNPEAQQMRVAGPSATVSKVAPGTVVSVKAVNSRGLEGWDWARLTLR
jgi:Tol biopolymer transport system component